MSSTVFVLIHCKIGSEEHIIKKLKSLDSVKEVQGVFGVYNILVQMETKEEKMIHDVVSSQIQKLENIQSVLTLVPK